MLTFLLQSKLGRVIHKIVLISVMSYGILLVMFGLSFRMWGQKSSLSLDSRASEDLDRRVSQLESQNLEHRITVMETVLSDLQSNVLWTRLNMAGIGLLITEAVSRAVNKRKKGTTE